jgi:hypothetical protein
VPAASAESTAASGPSAAEQAPADEAVLADEGNPEEALGDETIPSDEELQPDLYAELAAEQSAEEAPAPAAPRKPGILKIETVELSDAELATLAERKATTAMAKGRMQEAQDGYYEVLAHDPHNQGAREQLAGLLYGAGRLTEAAQVLEEGLRLDPAQADLRLLLARVAISGGIGRRRWIGSPAISPILPAIWIITPPGPALPRSWGSLSRRPRCTSGCCASSRIRGAGGWDWGWRRMVRDTVSGHWMPIAMPSCTAIWESLHPMARTTNWPTDPLIKAAVR